MNADIHKLRRLRNLVERNIPDTADVGNIWSFLGWDEDASEAYLLAKDHGVDLRPLLAPDFSDIVSIVVDGSYGFPYTGQGLSWVGILNGDFPAFSGDSPKARLLAVIGSTLRQNLDS